MISCKWILKNLNSYLDGELSSSIKKEINEHIAFCHRCKSIYDNARVIKDSMKNLPRIKTTDFFETELRKRILEENIQNGNVFEEWKALLPNFIKKPVVGFAVAALVLITFFTVNINNDNDGFKVTKQGIYKEDTAIPQKGGQQVNNIFDNIDKIDKGNVQNENKKVLSATPTGVNDSTEKEINVANKPKQIDANIQYINR